MDKVRADQRLPFGPEGDGFARRVREESDEDHDLFEEPMSFEEAEVLRRQKTVVVALASETNQRTVIVPEDSQSPRRIVDDSDEDTDLCEDPWSFEQIEALKRESKATVVSTRVKVDNAVLFTAEGYGLPGKVEETTDDEDDSREARLPVDGIEILQRQHRVLGLALSRVETNNRAFFSQEISQPSTKVEDEYADQDELREAPLLVKQVEALNRPREMFEPSIVDVHQAAFIDIKSDGALRRTNDESDEEDDLCEAPLSVEQVEALKRQQRAVIPPLIDVDNKTNVESKADEPPGPEDEGSDEDDDLCETPLSFGQFEALKRQQKRVVLSRVEIDSETIFIPKHIEPVRRGTEESDEEDDLCEPPLSVEQMEALKRHPTVVAPPRVEANNITFFSPEITEPSKTIKDESDEEDDLIEPPLSVGHIEALKRQHREVPPPPVNSEIISIFKSSVSTRQSNEESDEEDDLCEPPLSFERIEALKRQQTVVAPPRLEVDSGTIFVPKHNEISRQGNENSEEEDDLREPPLSVEQMEAMERQQRVAESAVHNRAIPAPIDDVSSKGYDEESDEDSYLREDPWSFEQIEALRPRRVDVTNKAVFTPGHREVSQKVDEESDEEDDLCEPPLSVEQIQALKRQQTVVVARPRVEANDVRFFTPEISEPPKKVEDESDKEDDLIEPPLSVHQIEAVKRQQRVVPPVRVAVDSETIFILKSSESTQQTNDESDEEDDLCEPPLSVDEIEALKREQRAAAALSVRADSESTQVLANTESAPGSNEESDEEDDLCEPPLSFEQIKALQQQQRVISSPRVELVDDSETIFVSRRNDFLHEVNGHSKEEDEDDLCETPFSFVQIERFKHHHRLDDSHAVPRPRRVRFASGNDEYIPHVYEIPDEDSDPREQPDCELAPSNPINPETTNLTPDLLPLADLTQKEIDRIVARIPGGVANIQDIYVLSPLQEGILFHRFLNMEGDPCLLTAQTMYTDRSSLDRYLAAAQKVINRHDALRTGFIWNGLSAPVQVVRRRVAIICEELALSPKNGPIEDQLAELLSPVRYRMELSRAPLLRFVIARNVNGDWILRHIMHPLIGDRTSLELVHKEIQVHLSGQIDRLPAPIPFRNLIARIKSDVDQDVHTSFFTEMLAEIEDPTLPFQLGDLQQNNSQALDASQVLAPRLTRRLRDQSTRYDVSVETLCHLAFAQLISRTSQQEKVVFGTVLSQRTQSDWNEGSELGLFVNTLPLRIDVNDDPVQDCVRKVHERWARLHEHRHAPFASAQRCSNVPDRTPLFSALLSCRRSIAMESLGSEVSDADPFRVTEYCNYPLTISVEDDDSTFRVTAKVVDPMDSERLWTYMQQALESLVDALEARPETPVRSLEILPEAERKMLLEAWNTVEPSYFEPPCAHRLFEQQVSKTPDAIALVCREEKLTYAEVNARANRLAHRMIELGVKPDGIVVICMSRTSAMLIGMLAILKAGGAYAPLDPFYPSGRLLYILNSVASLVVLADAAGRAVLGKDCLERCTVLDPNTTIEGSEENPEVPGLTSRNLIYVIHTSGSTGMPKGVMLEHRNIMWLLDAMETKFGFDHNDVWCLVHSFAFDFSVWEIWGAFRCGAQLHILPHRGAFSSRELHEYVCNNNVTVLHQTCSAFKDYCKSYIDNPVPDRLRYIIFAGEALEPGVLRLWYAARQGASPQMVNLYGVTETSVFVTYKALHKREAEQTLTSIGKCLPEASLYVLDDHRQLVPFGAVGELYVGGTAVARGYRNRPELNDERFVPDPFSRSSGERMYKTGDLVRYLPNGDLVFVTRNDYQLKFRGFRMEPGEIENWLKTHPAVHDAVALTVGDKQDNRLIAYVVADPVDNLAEKLRAYVAAELPSYMIPTDFVRVDEFPVSPNGKLDRSALPVPGDDAPAEESYEEPRGPIERALEFVWRNLFDVERINRTDSFFALGGDSLLAVRMFSRLAGYGLDIPLSTLSTTTSLAGLAEIITARLEDPVFV